MGMKINRGVISLQYFRPACRPRVEIILPGTGLTWWISVVTEHIDALRP